MNILYMTLISIAAGVAIALQSSMSGQFSSIVRSPAWTSLMIYTTSSIVMGFYLLVSKTRIPSFTTLKLVPIHLWFAGAFLSVLALTLVYWQMPKIGVARVMTGVLTGQLLISVIASHYGWFGLPVTTLTTARLGGVAFMAIGLFLINGSTN
jgi:transporter family-2 protein